MKPINNQLTVSETSQLTFVTALLLGHGVAPDAARHLQPMHSQSLDLASAEKNEVALPLGQAPLFVGTLVFPGRSHDWVVMNLSDDPLWKSGTFPVPHKTLRLLEGLERDGDEFDTLVIAHEIPKGACRPGEDLPLDLVTPPLPPQAVGVANMLGRVSHLVWYLPGLALTASAATVAAVLRDPILFGAKMQRGGQIQPGELADWYYLCRWSW